jgi:predicted enzyme related to lactoylglutathione lyase
MSGTGWGAAAPILRVRDLDASLEYYLKVLGFKQDWRAGMIASVTRDRCCVFLCTGDQSAPRMWVWLGVPDVRALHEELKASGAMIRHEPTNFEWALEMQVADPDGNVIRFGSAIEE